jgi:putative endonuclease
LHRKGKGAKYTKGKELTLLHSEYFSTRSEAMHRELEIKKMSKKEKKQLIQEGAQR